VCFNADGDWKSWTLKGREDNYLRRLMREQTSAHREVEIVPRFQTNSKAGHYLLYCRREVVQSAECGPVIAALARTEACS